VRSSYYISYFCFVCISDLPFLISYFCIAFDAVGISLVTQVLMAVKIQVISFWGVMSCGGIAGYQRFGGSF
jgi:hypothetical protein